MQGATAQSFSKGKVDNLHLPQVIIKYQTRLMVRSSQSSQRQMFLGMIWRSNQQLFPCVTEGIEIRHPPPPPPASKFATAMFSKYSFSELPGCCFITILKGTSAYSVLQQPTLDIRRVWSCYLCHGNHIDLINKCQISLLSCSVSLVLLQQNTKVKPKADVDSLFLVFYVCSSQYSLTHGRFFNYSCFPVSFSSASQNPYQQSFLFYVVS